MLLNKILKTYSILLSVDQVKNAFLVRIKKKEGSGIFCFSRWSPFI